MRICYIADGRSIHFHRWIRFFASRGHEMHFVSYHPVDSEQARAIQEAGAAYQGELGPFHVKRFWHTRRSLRWLKQILCDEKIDVLHCHFLGVNAWYSALSGFQPLVITVMGGDVCGPDWRPRGGRERLLTGLALRRAGLITCWSKRLAETVKQHVGPGATVEVVHGGIDLERFHPGSRPHYLLERWDLPEDARVVFSPRLMWPLYNTDRIAEAANRVCSADPEAYFLFAVPEPQQQDYEARVRAILDGGPAAGRFRFVGPIPHAEMADYYRLADVTISVPSTDGTPMSVLESLACGTPVVVSDLPDYDPDYIEPEKTVLAAPAEDAESIARSVLRLLDDSSLVERLTADARARIEARGSYEAQMARMEQLYRSLN
ncbi:MAG TPA: glycosyltransferase family 4 protein [Blastocatellia bacterium]|nr:glycosyltransferase family 4 protein [Blastocatellia bacterium]